MKTLFFHPQNDLTGSTRALANVIEKEYMDQHIAVITINNKIGFLSQLPIRIIPVYCPLHNNKAIPFFSSFIWRVHALLLALIYSFSFDKFYINTILPYYASIIGRLFRKEVIYHIHEKTIRMDKDYRIAEYVFDHVISKRIFVSEYLKNQYVSQEKCLSVVKYNSLPNSFLNRVSIVSIKTRKRNSVIMISSLTKIKGVFTFLDIARKMPDFHFVLLVSAEKEQTNKFLGGNLPDNFEIIAMQTDIHPYLKNSDLLLNLSIPSLCVETFGMTILEAMAYGIPAIVPSVGGPIELIKNGYNGFCIDVSNVDLVISTIHKSLNETEYFKLATNSLERLKHFA